MAQGRGQPYFPAGRSARRSPPTGRTSNVLILLTHANHLYFDAKQVRKMQPYPPLQTLILAALLRRNGYDVAFFDATFDCDFESALAKHRPGMVVVCED